MDVAFLSWPLLCVGREGAKAFLFFDTNCMRMEWVDVVVVDKMAALVQIEYVVLSYKVTP